jgi:uncharacterized membrane protein YGL010W
MRSAEEWFSLYGESHRNPTNKLIHWVFIPPIALSTLGLCAAIPHPFGESGLHWGVVGAGLTMIFYASLSWTLALGMALGAVIMLSINTLIASVLPIGWVSAGVFFTAWVAQFIGHKIEGKKPSFFQDLQFLLVGPAWLLQFIYRRVGIPL